MNCVGSILTLRRGAVAAERVSNPVDDTSILLLLDLVDAFLQCANSALQAVFIQVVFDAPTHQLGFAYPFPFSLSFESFLQIVIK